MSVQGSQEWFAERCGLVTASRFKDVLAKIKSGESASRRNYRAQLVCERLTNRPAETFTNAAMEWGTATEPSARMAYEAISGAFVEEVGFIKHVEMLAGASPDGLIGDDGMVEIKCPNTATHIDTLLRGMSADHSPQVQGQMWITNRKWVDFVSFDPRLPENLQIHIQRVNRDEKYINMLSAEVWAFLCEVEKTLDALRLKAA